MAIDINDIDFDNVEEVKKIQDQKVEISVGLLYNLLKAYYDGGGEPDSNNERLTEVMTYAVH